MVTLHYDEAVPPVEPLVSVLISTRDRASHLRDALPTVIAAVANAPWPTELVIVNNGSRDGTAGFLADLAERHDNVRHLNDERPPKSGALNRALPQLRGRAVLFTDDDVLVPPGWVADMAKPLLDGIADAVAGAVRLAPHLERPWLSPHLRVMLAEFDPGLEPHCGMVGANMAATRDGASSVGFDEQLGPGALGFADNVLFNLCLKSDHRRSIPSSGPPVIHSIDPERLQYRNMLNLAPRNGESHAYLRRHWLHARILLPRLRLMRDASRLKAFRILHRSFDHDITDIEYELTYHVSFLQFFMFELCLPSNYGPSNNTHRNIMSRSISNTEK